MSSRSIMVTRPDAHTNGNVPIGLYLTPDEAARRYGVSTSTLRRAARNGALPGSMKVRGHITDEWRLPIASLENRYGVHETTEEIPAPPPETAPVWTPLHDEVARTFSRAELQAAPEPVGRRPTAAPGHRAVLYVAVAGVTVLLALVAGYALSLFMQ